MDELYIWSSGRYHGVWEGKMKLLIISLLIIAAVGCAPITQKSFHCKNERVCDKKAIKYCNGMYHIRIWEMDSNTAHVTCRDRNGE